MNQKLFDYISACPTPYHTVAHSAKLLDEAGYTGLCEAENWQLEPGKGYYVTRNASSLIAFRLPTAPLGGYMITAAHGDAPCLKIKENTTLSGENYIKLSTEKYGGMLCATWFDRPLSVAGRITVTTDGGIESRLVDLKAPAAVIPSVAIHMNRSANDGFAYNAAVDMLPLLGIAGETSPLLTQVAAAAGVDEKDILTTDLFVYNPQQGVEFNGLISAPRLDDLQCVFGSLKAFIDASPSKDLTSAAVCCIFDNEEVGSSTKQGANSTFLSDTLERISATLGFDRSAHRCMLSNSFMVSCDNAHAIHPNHPEYADPNHIVKINAGIVIKYSAAQKYTSDAVSSAIFRVICKRADAPVQSFANRADMPGGSTLGNISNTHVSINTVDIGLPQLAMHSAYETAGSKDTEYLVSALKLFFESAVVMRTDGCYDII